MLTSQIKSKDPPVIDIAIVSHPDRDHKSLIPSIFCDFHNVKEIAEKFTIRSLYLGAYEAKGYGTIEKQLRAVPTYKFDNILNVKQPFVFPKDGSSLPGLPVAVKTVGTNEVDVKIIYLYLISR